MKLELPSQENFLTPETIGILRRRYEQAKAEVLEKNMSALDRVDQIQSDDLQKMIKARLGLIPIKAAGIDQELELVLSLN